MVENGKTGEGILAFVLPRLAGPALALAAYLPLHRAGVVAPLSPWWFVGVVTLGTSITILVQYRFREPAFLPQLHVRYAAQCASITAIIYCTGWGPGLAIVYLKSLADNLEISGSRASGVGTLWALAYMALAQAGIAMGLVPTMIATPGVHGLALLAGVGLAFVYWLVGTTVRHREEAEGLLRESERQLRDREVKLEEAQALSHLGSWHWDVDADVLSLSEELHRILDLEPGSEGEGMSFAEILERVHPEDRQLIRDTAEEAVATGEPFKTEHRLVRPDGSVRWVEARGRPTGGGGGARVAALHGTALDITERRQLEDQLLQAMKMRAIGKLAGGVAHDFNNLLTVIGGYANLLIKATDETDPRLEDLRRVRDATNEAADLTGELLAFGRRQVLHPEVVDAGELIGEMIPMLRRLIRENVEIDFRAAAASALVQADPTKLKQVVMNLAINARDAMPKGGILTVVVETVRLDGGYVDVHPQVEPGDYVKLRISDTGVGMDEATRSRIFEPFFTTKELGKGTGLGLATVYGFVQQSGGHINVYSEPGEGTTFTIYLPQAARETEQEIPVAELPATEGGTETILLAEDNTALRELCCSVLEAQGYEVLAAGDGEEALAVAGRSGAPIHLLITDLVMPGSSGVELIELLRSRYPDLPVLYISGHGPASVAQHGASPEGRQFLPKPFSTDELAQRVRQILDAAGPSRARE